MASAIGVPHRMRRRTFLRTIVYGSAAAAGVLGTGYGFFESGWLKVDRQTLTVPRLPAAFRGLKVAFLADIHHGPYVDLDYVSTVVRTTNLLEPDLVLLGGDYVLRESKYAGPCFDVLSDLRCPMGVHGVLGNHDYWHGVWPVKEAMKTAKVTELTNAGVWFERGGDRLRVGGVDDLWAGRPRLEPALGDATPADACVLVSHNPDFAETLTDRRVGLILSGHTHGGQVVIPGCGAPWTPSRYGDKYRRGKVEAPATTVYVSCGLGVSAIPARVAARPEINLFTLEPAAV